MRAGSRRPRRRASSVKKTIGKPCAGNPQARFERGFCPFTDEPPFLSVKGQNLPMVRDTPKRRLLKLLRRAARTARAGGGAGQVGAEGDVDENAIWLAHQRALTVVREGAESTQRIASGIAKQRGSVDSLGDRSRAAGARAQEMSTAFARVVDSFDRLALVALNAGLEGARLGESVGRSLLLVSDEVRAQTARGGDSARELA